MPRKYIAALVVIGLIFFGLVTLTIASLNKPDTDKTRKETKTSQNQPAQPAAKSLEKDARSVSYTIQGKLVGEESRRAIRITITGSERRAEVLSGYDESVIKTATFANKQSAFDTFLSALNAAGYTSRDSKITQSEDSACPSGKRYVYEVTYKDNSTQKTWNTSCGRLGNFRGNGSVTADLFKNQITDYDKFVKEVDL